MKRKIAVLPGDGIGPEVMTEALRVLDAVAAAYGHEFPRKQALVGGAAFEEFGCHMPITTLETCRDSSAILFGSVGGPVNAMDEPKWKDCERNSILALRKHFRFSSNLRPAKIYPTLKHLSPLKPEVLEKGVDMLIVRELLGDCYFGKHEEFEKNGERAALDESEYTEAQVKAAAHAAFQAARKRSNRVCSVDKANVLTTSRLWRAVVHEVAKEYPDVELSDMLVDNCAMQLIMNPAQFDVIVTTNMFGDILSDAAAALPGSLGLVASASLTGDGFGLYEPPGGSAQDIAGKGVANPIAQVLSVALMLRHSFDLEQEATAIETAVETALSRGYRTADIWKKDEAAAANVPSQNQKAPVSTSQMTDAILEALAEHVEKNARQLTAAST